MSLADLLRGKAQSLPAHAQASLAARMGFTQVRVEGQGMPTPSRGRPVVGNSEDLQRIIRLPTRETIEGWDFSWLKKTGPCKCAELGRPCCAELYPIQAQALTEAAKCDGLLGAIGVGHGKELVFQLLPLVMRNVRTAILLITPDMRESFRLDWEYYGQHWIQPNLVGGTEFRAGLPRLKVIAYSELSHEKFTAALQSWEPDLIMGNEAHAVSNLRSVRTSRILKFCADKPDCRTVWASGTLTSRSLEDYGHLAALALGEGSPLPIDGDTLAEWAQAIDPFPKGGKIPALMGALKALCRPGEDLRTAFKRRRSLTPGVVDTTEVSIPNALNIHRRDPPPIPSEVQEAMREVRRLAQRPDGEEFTEAWQVSKCLKELAAGFYYRWIYPRGEDPALIMRWFSARQAWNREVRELLKYPRLHLDSPKLAMRAAIRHAAGLKGTAEKPVWDSKYFAEWRAVHKLVRPEVEAVWISDWLARDALAWAASLTKGSGAILWYASGAFGRKLEELSGLKRYGGGSKASAEILRENGKTPIIASIKAHNKNKNLQAFSRNLIAQMPPDAAMWEQLLGRTHRRGQVADTVEAHLYLHTPELRESLDKAIKLSEYVEGTTPNRQKLCFATYTFPVQRSSKSHGARADAAED